MSDQIQEKLIEQHVEDLAGKRALAEPFPGPLKVVFALAPDIAVGPYKVRRFRDGDFKLLAALESPFKDFLMSCIYEGNASDDKDCRPTGQAMWDMALLFTQPAAYSRDLIVNGGKAGFKAKSEDDFSELRLPALNALLVAIMEQARIYASANIEYGAPDKKGEDGGSRPNPPSSAPQLTA